MKSYNIFDEYKEKKYCKNLVDYDKIWPPWIKNYTEYG